MPVSYSKAMLYLSANGDSITIKIIKNEQYGKGLVNATDEDNIHPLLKGCEKEGLTAVLKLLEKIKADTHHTDWVSLHHNTSQHCPGSIPLVALYGQPNRLARVQTVDELIVFVSLKLEKEGKKPVKEAVPAPKDPQAKGMRCQII